MQKLKNLAAILVGVIDTGVDIHHPYFENKIHPDIIQQRVSDLSTGLSNLPVYDNSHLLAENFFRDSQLNFDKIDQLYRMRNLRSHCLATGLSQDELQEYQKYVSDDELIDLNGWIKKQVHGTAVSSIILNETQKIKLYPIKGLNHQSEDDFSDYVKEKYQIYLETFKDDEYMVEMMMSLFRMREKFFQLVDLMKEKKARIVNMSFGVSEKNMRRIMSEAYYEIHGKEITIEQLERDLKNYYQTLFDKAEEKLEEAPDILFVFSAGNHSRNNDHNRHFPSKLRVQNAITVAAVNGEKLSSFSNFSTWRVDFAARGVAVQARMPSAIESTLKLNGEQSSYSLFSGTSMSAAMVSNLAARILEMNENLSSFELKQIMIKTAEYSAYLKDKLMNPSVMSYPRALKAAKLSKVLPLEKAILASKSYVIRPEKDTSLNVYPELLSKIVDHLKTNRYCDAKYFRILER